MHLSACGHAQAGADRLDHTKLRALKLADEVALLAYPDCRKPIVGMSHHQAPPFAERIGETKWCHGLARGAPQGDRKVSEGRAVWFDVSITSCLRYFSLQSST